MGTAIVPCHGRLFRVEPMGPIWARFIDLLRALMRMPHQIYSSAKQVQRALSSPPPRYSIPPASSNPTRTHSPSPAPISIPMPSHALVLHSVHSLVHSLVPTPALTPKTGAEIEEDPLRCRIEITHPALWTSLENPKPPKQEEMAPSCVWITQWVVGVNAV
jgi:hypothetical protein